MWTIERHTDGMLVLDRSTVESLLDLDALRDATAAAMVAVSAGRVSMPARIAAQVDARGLVAAMPAYLSDQRGLAVKLVSLFPANAGSSRPTHQAVIVVFDPDTGEPVALLDGTAITAARTAAASAVATQALAAPDAHTLALLGTGEQARAHAKALPRVRPLRSVRVAGRNRDRAAALAAQLRAELPGVAVEAVDSTADACRGADIVCATTHSPEPVVRRELLGVGAHVVSVGYNTAGREVDSATVADALVVVESRAAVLAPPPSGCNDLRIPIDEGRLDPTGIVELGELLAGDRPGRAAPEQLTLYKSVGIAAQDVAAATLVLAAARSAGAGQTIAI
jgi:ornithine cyclodeaminase/alanine dehydrogenase-like protein (mu-crystallin family)